MDSNSISRSSSVDSLPRSVSDCANSDDPDLQVPQIYVQPELEQTIYPEEAPKSLISLIAEAKEFLKAEQINKERSEELNVDVRLHNGSVDAPGLKLEALVTSGEEAEVKELAEELGVEYDQGFLISSFLAAEGTEIEALEAKLAAEVSQLVSFLSSGNLDLAHFIQNSTLTIKPKNRRLYVILAFSTAQDGSLPSLIREISSLASSSPFAQHVKLNGVWDIEFERFAEDERAYFENFIEDFDLDVTGKLWQHYRHIFSTIPDLKRKLGFLSYIAMNSGRLEFEVENLSSFPEHLLRKFRGREYPSVKAAKQELLRRLGEKQPFLLKTFEVLEQYFTADIQVFLKFDSLTGVLKLQAPGLSQLVH